MEYTGCKEDIVQLIDRGTELFAPRFSVNKNRMEDIDRLCALVDELVSEQGCGAVEVGIEEASRRFTVFLTGYDMTMHHGKSSPFFELIQLLTSFSFEKSGKEYVRLRLNIDDIWEEVD